MAQVHRVILLNKPLKIWGNTIMQWVMLALALAVSFMAFSSIPQQWKIGNLPTGILVGISLFMLSIVFIHAPQVKPSVWWKNKILYSLGKMPTKFFPRPEPAQEYPDSSIIEPLKQQDRYYVQKSAGKK